MKKIFDLFEFFGITDYYESNNLLISSCPIHDGNNSTAFNINIDEYNEEHYGKWFCNTKGCHNDKPGKDILSLVWMLLEKKYKKEIAFPEVVKFCNKFCADVIIDDSGINAIKNDVFDKLIKLQSRKILKENSSKIRRDVVRSRLKFPATFYINRGFSEEALNEFDVGLCTNPKSQMYQRIVFPVYDENDEFMVGCTGRTICDSPRKWINQKGFNKSNFLYNYGKAIEHIRTAETIILVEGQGDVIRLWESGIRNAVGMFGSKISDSQEFLIQKTGVSNIVIMSDNDQAGDICSKDITERLKYLFNIYTINLPKNDIGDMSIDEINNTIKPQIQGKYL
jgi:5S rRNA maturation endonuclease (ribonuclease M5)